MNVSYLPPGEMSKVKTDVPLLDILKKIKHDKPIQDKVLEVRNGKRAKSSIGSYTPSGSFIGTRKRGKLKQHSGVIAIDVDHKDNPEIAEKRGALEADEHCFACHQSVGGFGLVWYVKVNPTKHLEAFKAIEKYLANTYQIIIDTACKDVSRLRYLSFDPHLYLNETSKKWSKYLTKKEKGSTEAKRVPMAFGGDDMLYIMEQISSRGVNIADDYYDWLNCSFALADKFGEQGRAYFHEISRTSPKYEHKKCDRQYNIAVKRGQTGITIGTFFHLCKGSGIDIRKPETKEAEIYFKQRVRSEPDLPRGEAVKSTMEFMSMRGVSPDSTKGALEAIKDIPVNQFQTIKVNDKVLELETFIKSFNLKFNEITRYVEIDSRQMDDRDYFTIYRKAMHVIDYSLSKNKLFDLINSDLIPAYHPFRSFFENNKHLKPSGNVSKLLKCFEYREPEVMDGLTPEERETDYLDMFLHRWLLGIVSAMNGTYSLLTLVLCGPQGCGKSKFFRNLLPDELQDFYAEGKMESDNDAKEMMTKKLLVMDDEFGGKNKTNAVRFKEISSKDRFYVKKPYGKVWEDLKRYAVLCGTSNDSEVLIDPTGNRRLIPVDVISIDHKKMAEIDKVELFMELFWDWREVGNKWMLTKKDIAYLNKSTLKNERRPFEEEMINKYFEPMDQEGGNSIWLTASEIKVKIDTRTGNRIYEGKIGQILKKLGFTGKQKRRRGRKYPEKCYLVVDHGTETHPPTTTQGTDF